MLTDLPAVQSLPTNLIPDEVQNELIAWGDRRKRDNRWLGQKVLYIFARMQEEAVYHPRMDVYKAIGQLAGTAARTIRYHARLAEFYPDPVWQLYDVLPYSHFDFAAHYPSLSDLILATSVAQMDHNGGKPPTVEWLRWRFAERIAALTEDPEDTDQYPDDDTDPNAEEPLKTTREILSNLYDKTSTARDLMPNQELRTALDDILQQIIDITDKLT